MDSDTFRKFVEEKRSYYKRIGKIFCPILNKDVYFNAQGFHHLRYNGLGQARPAIEQFSRMQLLVFTTQIIREAKKFFNYRKRYEKSIGKDVEYWELQQWLNNKVITVIIRRAGAGKYSFYSIWKKRK